MVSTLDALPSKNKECIIELINTLLINDELESLLPNVDSIELSKHLRECIQTIDKYHALLLLKSENKSKKATIFNQIQEQILRLRIADVKLILTYYSNKCTELQIKPPWLALKLNSKKPKKITDDFFHVYRQNNKINCDYRTESGLGQSLQFKKHPETTRLDFALLNNRLAFNENYFLIPIASEEIKRLKDALKDQKPNHHELDKIDNRIDQLKKKLIKSMII